MPKPTQIEIIRIPPEIATPAYRVAEERILPFIEVWQRQLCDEHWNWLRDYTEWTSSEKNRGEKD